MKARIAVVAAGLATALGTWVALGTQAHAEDSSITFDMVRSSGAVAANCLPDAAAKVRVVSHDLNETLTLKATGLPPDTNFDLFITQLPNAPFGVSWYQSDLRSDDYGNASVKVVGRFNIETFAVAPGVGPAPATHPDKDATSNPAFGPIHTYHVGFWFNSPDDAVKAGCPGTVTPFNGDHTAGIQAMSTRNFGDLAGPLSQLG